MDTSVSSGPDRSMTSDHSLVDLPSSDAAMQEIPTRLVWYRNAIEPPNHYGDSVECMISYRVCFHLNENMPLSQKIGFCMGCYEKTMEARSILGRFDSHVQAVFERIDQRVTEIFEGVLTHSEWQKWELHGRGFHPRLPR